MFYTFVKYSLYDYHYNLLTSNNTDMFKKELDFCSECDCGKKQLIVNRSRWLCDKKNKERLEEKNPKVKKELKKTYMKKISGKQRENNAEYFDTLQHIKETREKKCTGCGMKQGEVSLTHSHIISRSDCKRIGRPELIYDENNITYHCGIMFFDNDCHSKWERRGERNKLLDYEKNLEYIRSISEELYNKYKQD